MVMRRLNIFIFIGSLLLFLPLTGIRAQQVTLSGKIVDSGSGEPMEFASVTLERDGDSVLVAGAIANEEGYFTLGGEFRGNYRLKATFIGYVPYEEMILIGELNDIYQLGDIVLAPSTSELDEVTVRARGSITSAGLEKTTFDMEEMLAQSGGSVLDALRGVPGVSVSQEGKVILRGSDRVAILIDGKQSSITGFGNQKGLDNIPVSNIERIEIINNPSARYEASGMAGIINIIYRKEKEFGFHGDVGFTYGLGNLTERKPDLPTDLGSFSVNSKYIPSLGLDFKQKKFRLFLQSEMIHQAALPNNEFTTRYYDDGTGITSQVPENRKQTRYILNGGVDWYIDDRNQVTLSGIYDYESHVDTAQVPYLSLDDMERMRYWAWREYEITGYMNYRVQYLHKFREPGHEINASIQYTRGWEDESYYLRDSSSIRQSVDSTHILATEYISSASVDYTRPLKHGRLEAGGKGQLRRLPVTYTVAGGEASVIYPGLGDWSDWGEDLYAGYLNYIREMPRYDIEAGIRAEYTRVFYDLAPENIYYDENDSYSYFRLFPNVRITLKVDEHHRISLFYNHRVDRPGEPELRVYPKYDDPELLKVGNPYLRPQFTQSFEIAFRKRWETGSFFLSGYHKIIDDYFTRIYSVDTTSASYDIINKIYQNVGRATNSGTEVILTQDLGEMVKLSGSFNGYRIVSGPHTGEMLFPYHREFTIDRTVDLTWDTKLSGQVELPWSLDLQLSWIYYAPKTIPQGEQLARSSLDLGIRKKLFGGSGELSFSASDLMNRFGIRQEIQGDGFSALYENYYETQVIRLGYKHKF
jgi:outer membrane receptor protein involved in Fe transport